MTTMTTIRIMLTLEEEETLKKARELLCEIRDKTEADGNNCDCYEIIDNDIIEDISNLCDYISSYCDFISVN